jgi:preprotein translocase subunit SecE
MSFIEIIKSIWTIFGLVCFIYFIIWGIERLFRLIFKKKGEQNKR